MSDDCYLYLLLTAKVFVVVHFACNKGVGSLLQCGCRGGATSNNIIPETFAEWFRGQFL